MKFIINLLSAMGLGVKGSMLTPKSFVIKLERQFPWAKFKLIESANDTVVVEVETDGEISHLIYQLDGTRITNVQYTMGT